MTWLLCDYGEVLSAPQDPTRVAAMAARCGMDGDTFASAYWRRRVEYDRGTLTARRYWSTVVGSDPGDLVAGLVADDVASWVRLRPSSLAAVGRAAARGLRPAILSNAPREVGLAIDALPELGSLSPRLFSWAMGMAKPDPAIFERALAELGAAAGDVVFVDDRPDNVAAARDLGIRAEVFTGPGVFDGL